MNNGYELEFYDQASLTIPGDVASFVTCLVGVGSDITDITYLRQFMWQSTFNGISGNVRILAASDLGLTNGTGGITNVQANVQPADIPASALFLMNQIGGTFPVTIQPAAQTVVTGANVTFAISPTNSSSPLNYQWRFNGTNILAATNLTLQLLNASTNSTGNYDAVLSNTNGSVASAVATLTIVNIPIFQAPVIIENRQLLLTWTAPLGMSCQLQYTTNLDNANWINVGSAITASNITFFATNTLGLDKQRFYRIQQQ
jgi:hypothetical protein